MCRRRKLHNSVQAKGLPGVPHVGLEEDEGASRPWDEKAPCIPSPTFLCAQGGTELAKRGGENADVQTRSQRTPLGGGAEGVSSTETPDDRANKGRAETLNLPACRGRNVRRTCEKRHARKHEGDSQSTKSSPLFRPLACISLASASALAFIMKTLWGGDKCLVSDCFLRPQLSRAGK